ncbi:MAG: insulinase family protein [Candidatus Andersenbacteria bacterium]|nr:insulinase family protein [Candidatus Andersenbacteria bacterium]
MFRKTTLENGLRVITAPMHGTNTVTILVLCETGSDNEPEGKVGISHFLEHMFFKGTEKRPDKREIAETLDRVGAEFNAFTAEELTAYYVKVPAEHLRLAVDVVSDILLRSLFPAPEIEREKGVIAEEIRMYTDSPMSHVQHLWLAALFGAHPLGRRIDGSLASVRAFTRRDFRQYTKRHYHTGNAVVAVAGRFETDEVRGLVRKAFEPLPTGAATHPRVMKRRLPARRLVHERRPTLDQTHLVVGVPGIRFSDPRRFAADILATLLGGGMSSRLFMRVREERGLAYAVRASSENFVDCGSWVVQAGLRSDGVAEAWQIINEEFDRVMDELVSEGELSKAQEMLRGRLVMGLEETNAQALFCGGQALLEGSVRAPEDIWREIARVRVRDVQRVAKELLPRSRRAAALLGPQRSVRRLEEMLGVN